VLSYLTSCCEGLPLPFGVVSLEEIDFLLFTLISLLILVLVVVHRCHRSCSCALSSRQDSLRNTRFTITVYTSPNPGLVSDPIRLTLTCRIVCLRCISPTFPNAPICRWVLDGIASVEPRMINIDITEPSVHFQYHLVWRESMQTHRHCIPW
jgi:hypothetical protein